MLKDLFQDILYRLSQPLVSLLIRLGISPDILTLLGLLANVLAACFMVSGAMRGFAGAYPPLITGGLFLLLGGFFDILDGRVARMTGKASPAGALFDSVLDRYAELLMFLGIGWMAWTLDQPRSLLAAYLAMSFSIMVSYTRARTEGLGLGGSFGLFQRPERIVLISLAAIVAGLAGQGQWWSKPEAAWQRIFEPALWLVASGAGFTAIHRLFSGYRNLLRRESGP